MAHVQQHGRLGGPAGVLTAQEEVEESPLKLPPVVGVVVRPVFQAMQFEPLARRVGLKIPLDVASQMQPLPAPVAAGEQRDGYPREVRDVLGVVTVEPRMTADLLAEVYSCFLQLGFGERLLPRDRLAGRGTARAVLAEAVLHRLYLHVVPVGPEY
jgi:hypothetical protein